MKSIAVKGLNAQEYEAIKQAAKNEIPFAVNIRTHKQKYAYGSVDIRPKAPRGNHDPFFRWSKEEFAICNGLRLRYQTRYYIWCWKPYYRS